MATDSPEIQTTVLRAAVAGVLGGFIGNALLGMLFSADAVRAVLYNPEWQSRLFLELTPTRNIPLSVAGLIALSAFHGLLYRTLRSALPGRSWWARGLYWGAILWLLYWLFQEWFIYVTLLLEPLLLASFELSLLLCGSLLEGLVIAFVTEHGRARRRPTTSPSE